MFFIPDSFLDEVLSEDIPYGDLTVKLLGIENRRGQVRCYPKADGVVSGIDPAARIFRRAGLDVQVLHADGDRVPKGEPVIVARGSAGAIHAVYKAAQNILEYCSGISGRTRAMVDAAQAEDPRCQVALTRKHFPGTKLLSLYAGLAGGAVVHRMGLSESVLVFDQHRVFRPDFLDWLQAVKAQDPERKIAVEASSPEEALAFARHGADIVQCERFSPEVLRGFVGQAKAERPGLLVSAAGGVKAENAGLYAKAGADFLVTTWPYFGRPFDIKMEITAD